MDSSSHGRLMSHANGHVRILRTMEAWSTRVTCYNAGKLKHIGSYEYARYVSMHLKYRCVYLLSI